MSEMNEEQDHQIAQIKAAAVSDTPRGRLARLIALGLDYSKDITEWSVDYQSEMLDCADVIIDAGWIEKEEQK